MGFLQIHALIGFSAVFALRTASISALICASASSGMILCLRNVVRCDGEKYHRLPQAFAVPDSAFFSKVLEIITFPNDVCWRNGPLCEVLSLESLSVNFVYLCLTLHIHIFVSRTPFSHSMPRRNSPNFPDFIYVASVNFSIFQIWTTGTQNRTHRVAAAAAVAAEAGEASLYQTTLARASAQSRTLITVQRRPLEAQKHPIEAALRAVMPSDRTTTLHRR